MKYSSFIIFCLLICSGCSSQPEQFSAMASSNPPQFERVEIHGIFKGCFEKVYVPAVYRITTEGALLSKARKRYEVVTAGGGTKWNLVREPAVYMEKKTLVAHDHYSLHEVDCATSNRG